MSQPGMIKQIQDTVSIPVMAKVRIGHFAEAQILEALVLDWLEHVVDGMHLESIHGVLVVGGHEHHRRRLWPPRPAGLFVLVSLAGRQAEYIGGEQM